jgi:hypothetical protein
MKTWSAVLLGLLATAPAALARELDPTLPLALALDPPVVSQRALPRASLPRAATIAFRLRVASSLVHPPVVTRDGSVLLAHGEPLLAEYDGRGRVLWAARLGSPAASSPVVFSDGRRAVVTQAGELRSFSRRGRELTPTRLPFSNAGDGLIVEASPDGGLLLAEHGRCVRLDATGTLISETRLDAEIVAVSSRTPEAVSAPASVLLVTAGGSVYELKSDGRAAVKSRFSGRVTAAARLGAERLLAVLDERRLVELNVGTDTEKTRAESPDIELGGPLAINAAGDSRLAGGDFLLAFDAQQNERFRIPLVLPGAVAAGRDAGVDFVLDRSGAALVVRSGSGTSAVAPDGQVTRIDGSACPEPLRPAWLPPQSAIVACRSGILLRLDAVQARPVAPAAQ